MEALHPSPFLRKGTYTYPRVWPHHVVRGELVRACRVLRERGSKERNVVGPCLLPALVEVGMPEGEVTQMEDFPGSVLEDVFVFVDSISAISFMREQLTAQETKQNKEYVCNGPSFPPLSLTSNNIVTHAFMRPCTHQSTESHLRDPCRSRGIDVHNILRQ